MSDREMALRLVLNLLDDGAVGSEAIIEAVREVEVMLRRRGKDVPLQEELVREVEARVNVWQPAASVLHNAEGHIEWLPTRRAAIDWNYWNRYRRYLEDVQLQPRNVVWRLDEVTDSILRKLEDPSREGSWDRRGLVVGQVQSGKTSNYTGLVCKAADAGYKLIIVLAGIHNSLRSQTQLRLDEGFLGFDSQYQHRIDDTGSNHRIGAGALPGFARLKPASLTTSAERGDFRDAVARQLNLPLGAFPVLLVVKKHARILENIHAWVTGVDGELDPNSGLKMVRDVPLLIIDDEADNASINTGKIDGETDPTSINRAIRKLLRAFDQSAYVGYTATPFANIYSESTADHDEYGRDLFPDSFIESLRAPTNYFGPVRVFGLGENDEPALPIHRAAEDAEEWMPSGHKKHWLPPAGQLPDSLLEAFHAFLLSCASRRARGQVHVHNSMLVHVTRFQDVQEHVTDQLRDLLQESRDRLRYGDGERTPTLLQRLRDLWERDFNPTTQRFPAEGAARLTWAQVSVELLPALEKIELRTMNGKAKEALEYYDRRTEGLSVIAIGGDKLSRGLTLEGLTVSYYLRATQMYDTLMQMGRWFGYRPGYEDMCRLYTTTELRGWYREITLAAEEFNRELEEMAAQGATPEQYGLRVRKSPAGLNITAANKMRRAETVRLSFSGAIPETVLFDVRPQTLRDNLQILENLTAACQDAGQVRPRPAERDNLVWEHVPGSVVADTFLQPYQADPTAWRVNPQLIAAYIRKCVATGELGEFTVALISNTREGRPFSVGGHKIGLTTRKLLDPERRSELTTHSRYAIRRVLSPTDERIGLSEEQYERALQATIASWRVNPGRSKRTDPPTEPSGAAMRRQRRPEQGLLLIYVLDNTMYVDEADSPEVAEPMVGFALSLPHSEQDIAVEYAVNEVWQARQFSDPEDLA